MNPDEYYNSPYGYSHNSTTCSSWFIIIVLLILAVILLKLGNRNTDSTNIDSAVSCNTDGIAEYWYSDNSEQTDRPTVADTNRSNIYSTPVLDKKMANPIKHSIAGTFRGILFWI